MPPGSQLAVVVMLWCCLFAYLSYYLYLQAIFLAVDSVTDAAEHYADSEYMVWRLNPQQIRDALACRIDFDKREIEGLSL